MLCFLFEQLSLLSSSPFPLSFSFPLAAPSLVFIVLFLLLAPPPLAQPLQVQVEEPFPKPFQEPVALSLTATFSQPLSQPAAGAAARRSQG